MTTACCLLLVKKKYKILPLVASNILQDPRLLEFPVFSLTYDIIEHSPKQPNIGEFGTKYHLYFSPFIYDEVGCKTMGVRREINA